MAVKKVLAAYHKHRGDKEKGFERLDMRSIPNALEWAGYEFSRSELDALFSGSGKYGKCGTKSAKKLRDGVTHERNENDIREIAERFEELDAMMDAFLSHFRWTEEALKTKKKAQKAEAEAVPV